MMQTNIADAMANGYNEAGLAISMSTAAMDPGFADLKKVASTVKFLCSDDSSAINGTCVTVDNGWMAY